MNTMNPFNVGDRVEATRKIGRIKCGETGTVCAEELDVGMYVRVRWDRNVGGHSCGGHCEQGRGSILSLDILPLYPKRHTNSIQTTIL